LPAHQAPSPPGSLSWRQLSPRDAGDYTCPCSYALRGGQLYLSSLLWAGMSWQII